MCHISPALKTESHYFIINGSTVRLNNDNLWCIFSVMIILNLQTWLLRCGTKFTSLSPHMFGLWSQAGMFSHSVVLSCTSSNMVYSRKFSPINSPKLEWNCLHFTNSIFNCRFTNECHCIFIPILTTYVSMGLRINTLRPGDACIYQGTWISLV